MTRDEIEAVLMEELDPEILAVYSDFLQAEGDPRGELIALDLADRDEPERRTELAEEWLGGPLARVTDIAAGFLTLELVDPAVLAAWVATPTAHYVRSATISGHAQWVGSAVRAVAEHSGRWLHELVLHVTDHNQISDRDAAAMAATSPRLDRLEVSGHRALGDVGHLRVKSLRVTGWDAIESLLDDGPTRFPAVTMLDLAFNAEVLPTNRAFLSRLPSLSWLDLSSNEPGNIAPHNLGGSVRPLWALLSQPHLDRLTHLRLPSIRTEWASDQLGQLLARAPHLRDVSVARMYEQDGPITLPAGVDVPTPWPWPSPDVAEERLAFSIDDTSLPVVPLIVWLETAFEHLSPPVQSAWMYLFQLVGPGRVSIPPDVVRRVVSELDPPAPWRYLQGGSLVAMGR